VVSVPDQQEEHQASDDATANVSQLMERTIGYLRVSSQFSLSN
jgi:hypothetical protein